MIHRLIHRPIAVSMVASALVILGLLAARFIPISLMPDLAVPQISVQVACSGHAAVEVEQRYVSPLQGQLLSVGGVRDIKSESRSDVGTILLSFHPGTDMDLAFIEVNEKIDRAMGNMPVDMERPKVIKRGVSDIPAFFLDVWMKGNGEADDERFAQLSQTVRNVIAKRIEQLPQTAMVDISGTVGTEIVCTPDEGKMQALGLTTQDLEDAIRANDLQLEALRVADGILRYHVGFDAPLLTVSDIGALYIAKEGRLLQLRDVCRIEEHLQRPDGIVRHNGHRAVTMAVVKQSDARMNDLQERMAVLMKQMEEDYPDLRFELTRDQTRLLAYTIANLGGNLLVGAVLACCILVLFMRRWRISLLVICSIPFSLILTLLGFYLSGMSLNVLSLSGLILGVGMIVDNSIIVTDNIIRRWHLGEPLTKAVVEGAREVFAPMLSSVLTTCSIFIPLVFLSGLAGSLFFDQAMAITYSLAASLFVAATVVPIYFFTLYHKHGEYMPQGDNDTMPRWMVRCYERVLCWLFRRKKRCLYLFLAGIPLLGMVVWIIEKQHMPDLPHDDMLVYIDWNSGISVEENDRRVESLMRPLLHTVDSYTTMAGLQQFMLAHTKDITSSEAILYVKTSSADSLKSIRRKLAMETAKLFPNASVAYEQANNVFSLLFGTEEADLEVCLQRMDGGRPPLTETKRFIDSLQQAFPDLNVPPLVTESEIRYHADMDRMALYGISYQALYQRIYQLINHRQVMKVNDGAQTIPILMRSATQHIDAILRQKVRNDSGTEIPIALVVKPEYGEHYKRLTSSSGGDCYTLALKASNRQVRDVMAFTERYIQRHDSKLTASYAGSYFASRRMLKELAMVLTVSILLLYLILAAQFESLTQPAIILSELVLDMLVVIAVMWALGMSLNVMSMVGLIVMSGIVINDSILKIDTINRLCRSGRGVLSAVIRAGHQRLRPILITSLTTILAIIPCLRHADMGSALQYPLSVTLIVGLTVGTFVSLFMIPIVYYLIYRHKS